MSGQRPEDLPASGRRALDRDRISLEAVVEIPEPIAIEEHEE